MFVRVLVTPITVISVIVIPVPLMDNTIKVTAASDPWSLDGQWKTINHELIAMGVGDAMTLTPRWGSVTAVLREHTREQLRRHCLKIERLPRPLRVLFVTSRGV